MLDLIVKLRCSVIVAARNRLGVINHTLLTVKTMQAIGVKNITVSLMNVKHSDISALSNQEVLREMLSPISICSVPFLGASVSRIRAINTYQKKIKKTLAQILNTDTVSTVRCEHAEKSD